VFRGCGQVGGRRRTGQRLGKGPRRRARSERGASGGRGRVRAPVSGASAHGAHHRGGQARHARRSGVASSREGHARGRGGGFELYASVESQSCFSNAYLELLEAPNSEADKLGTAGALRALCDALKAEGIVACFALAPSDAAALAWAYLQSGFRRTGLLLGHLVVRGERKDAIVWSRKLANPAED